MQLVLVNWTEQQYMTSSYLLLLIVYPRWTHSNILPLHIRQSISALLRICRHIFHISWNFLNHWFCNQCAKANLLKTRYLRFFCVWMNVFDNIGAYIIITLYKKFTTLTKYFKFQRIIGILYNWYSKISYKLAIANPLLAFINIHIISNCKIN